MAVWNWSPICYIQSGKYLTESLVTYGTYCQVLPSNQLKALTQCIAFDIAFSSSKASTWFLIYVVKLKANIYIKASVTSNSLFLFHSVILIKNFDLGRARHLNFPLLTTVAAPILQHLRLLDIFLIAKI